MRFVSLLFGFLTVTIAVSGQNVRELTIYTENTTIQNFHLEEGDTLQLIFEVDPYSVTFTTSTLFRIPSGLFARDTLREFVANSASISELTPSDFTNAVSLENLYLISNTITTLVDNVFASAPRLRHLRLAFNGITTVGANAFAGLEDLTYLTLYANSIATLAPTVFAPLTSVSTVDLGSNQLSNVNFANFSNSILENLYLEHNRFSSINAGDLVAPYLTSLSLSGNQISRLENDVFSQVPALNYLYLSDNTMEEIEEDAFNGLSQLSFLELFYNRLSELPPSVFVPLRSLTILDLGFNQIKDISFRHFSSQQYLTSLWLGNNNISQLDIRKFVALRSLSSFQINDNQLTELNFNNVGFILPNLAVIDLSRNEFYCGEVAQILANLRQFNIYSYDLYGWSDYEMVLLDGIACYEHQSIGSLRKKSTDKRFILTTDHLYKLKMTPPAKSLPHIIKLSDLDLKL